MIDGVQLKINGVFVDLFGDEEIFFEKRVKDINDINQIFGDRTQPFTLPATEKNNKVFKHYRRVDKNEQFSAYSKSPAEIWLNGNVYSSGFIQFLKASYSNGDPVSYQITYFNDLVGLSDLFGDATLRELEALSAYDHNYDEATVKTGIQSGLFSGAIRYPMVSTDRFWQFLPEDSTTESTATLPFGVNIGKNYGAINYLELRPAIRLDLVWEAIKTQYGLTIDSDFDTGVFWSNLYLHCYDGKGREDILRERQPELTLVTADDVTTNPLAITEVVPPFTAQVDSDGLFNQADNTFTAPNNGSYTFNVLLWGKSRGSVDLRVYKNGALLTTFTWTAAEFNAVDAAGLTVKNIGPGVLATGDEIEFRFVGVARFNKNCFVTLDDSSKIISSQLRVRSNIPRMRIVDFIGSLCKIYNCVIIPKVDGSYEIKRRLNWLGTGSTVDISKYVDLENLEIKPVGVYKNINFQFENDEDVLNVGYKSLTGNDSGSLKYRTGSDFGEDYDVSAAFGYSTFTKLNEFDNSALTVMYPSFYVDSEGEQGKRVEVNPRIMFYNGQSTVNGTGANQPANGLRNGVRYLDSIAAVTPANILDNDGGTVYDATGNNTAFSALTSVPQFLNEAIGFNRSLGFTNERSIVDNAIVDNNSFTLNYQDEIVGVFDSSNRLYTVKAAIPLGLIQSMQLNNKYVVNGAITRINRIQINLLTGECELELYTDYDEIIKKVL